MDAGFRRETSSGPRRRTGVGTAAAAACVMALAGGAVPASARAPAGAPVTAAALALVPMPKDCGALTTLVTADRVVRFGIVDGTTGDLVPGGVTLSFMPRAVTYVVSSSNRGVTIRRLLANDVGSGGLHLITLTDRVDPATKKQVTTSSVTRIGSGWRGVRLLVSSYPYVYGVNDAGALKRYKLTDKWRISGAGTVRKRGWSQVRSLSRGDLWNLGRDTRGRVRYGDDLVGVLSTGALKAYLIPRDNYQALRSFTLAPTGWNVFRHVSVGTCESGKARPLVGVDTSGGVQAYLDANGDDQRGTDIRRFGRVDTGWTGLLAD